MQITVYVRSGYHHCTATINKLESVGLDFQTINLDNSPSKFVMIEEYGYVQLPVVVVEDQGTTDHWSTFRPDKIIALAEKQTVA